MNCTSSLIFAIAVLAQIISCDYKVVCRTEYSYVLKNFSQTAKHFQAHLGEAQACFDPSVVDIVECLTDKILPPYSGLLLDSENGYCTPFKVADVNDMHQKACKILNDYAEREKYAKDIPLKEYNVLTETEHIKALMDGVAIGIKVKTNKSVVLKCIGRTANLMNKHFKTIKFCLGKDTLVDQHTFTDCISENVLYGDELASKLYNLPNDVHFSGGLSAVDDIDLKIELNKYLTNLSLGFNDDEDYSRDIKIKEYECTLGDEEIDKLIKECTKWYWIKVGGGVFAIAVLAGLVGYIYKKKAAFVYDEEKVDSET